MLHRSERRCVRVEEKVHETVPSMAGGIVESTPTEVRRQDLILDHHRMGLRVLQA
jgi:hypothetical protein